MRIHPAQLEFAKQVLRDLVDERTSAPWADYSEEDLSRDEQDREDIEKIQTVADVLEWLQHQGKRALLIEYASRLDPLGGGHPLAKHRLFLLGRVDPANAHARHALRRYAQLPRCAFG